MNATLPTGLEVSTMDKDDFRNEKLYQATMGMARKMFSEGGIPPFVPAGIRAEPFRFMPENLVYLLAATLAKTCSRFQWVNCLRSGGRTSTDVISGGPYFFAQN